MWQVGDLSSHVSEGNQLPTLPMCLPPLYYYGATGGLFGLGRYLMSSNEKRANVSV